MAKKILKWAGVVLGAVVLAAVVLVAWLTIREYKPDAVEGVEIAAFANQTVAPGDSFTVSTQNTGYAGLGADSDFFMDGGGDVAPTKEQQESNQSGLAAQLEQYGADYVEVTKVK